jgi:hypothetical protein
MKSVSNYQGTLKDMGKADVLESNNAWKIIFFLNSHLRNLGGLGEG